MAQLAFATATGYSSTAGALKPSPLLFSVLILDINPVHNLQLGDDWEFASDSQNMSRNRYCIGKAEAASFITLSVIILVLSMLV